MYYISIKTRFWKTLKSSLKMRKTKISIFDPSKYYSLCIIDAQFDMITGLEAKNGYKSDSSIHNVKNVPRGACPRNPLDGRAFGVPF